MSDPLFGDREGFVFAWAGVHGGNAAILFMPYDVRHFPAAALGRFREGDNLGCAGRVESSHLRVDDPDRRNEDGGCDEQAMRTNTL